MKKVFITLTLILGIFTSIKAQDQTQVRTQRKRDKSIYFELFGPSNLIGISYDARFKNNNHLGYRIGLGYDYGKTEITGFFNSKSHAFTVPIEINCLAGNGSSRLELGLGTSLCLYYSHWRTIEEKDSASTFGYFCHCNLGYRLTTKKGFQFRIGLTPTFHFGGEHAVKHDPKLYPYLSLGYAF